MDTVTVVVKHCLFPWELEELLPGNAYGFKECPEWDCIIYYIDKEVSKWEL